MRRAKSTDEDALASATINICIPREHWYSGRCFWSRLNAKLSGYIMYFAAAVSLHCRASLDISAKMQCWNIHDGVLGFGLMHLQQYQHQLSDMIDDRQ